MKKTIALLILGVSMSSVMAADMFENNNPFPQTQPQYMNNLYEADQATLQHEAKQEKKSWFKKGKTLREQEIQDAKKRLYTYPPSGAKDEGVYDGGFYMFNN